MRMGPAELVQIEGVRISAVTIRYTDELHRLFSFHLLSDEFLNDSSSSTLPEREYNFSSLGTGHPPSISSVVLSLSDPSSFIEVDSFLCGNTFSHLIVFRGKYLCLPFKDTGNLTARYLDTEKETQKEYDVFIALFHYTYLEVHEHAKVFPIGDWCFRYVFRASLFLAFRAVSGVNDLSGHFSTRVSNGRDIAHVFDESGILFDII